MPKTLNSESMTSKETKDLQELEIVRAKIVNDYDYTINILTIVRKRDNSIHKRIWLGLIPNDNKKEQKYSYTTTEEVVNRIKEELKLLKESKLEHLD